MQLFSKVSITVLVLFISTLAFSQADTTVYQIVEKMPKFPGHKTALFDYIGANIKYPAVAKDAGIEGTVYVGFVVEKDGSLSDIAILRGIGGGCDAEALRVVNAMPSWTPGMQAGQTVRVQNRLPIKFVLEKEETVAPEVVEEEKEEVVEMPEYPGGEYALFAYLGKNIHYPDSARDAGIAGVVYVGFVVEKDGSISNIEILQGIGGGCDEEVIRLIKNMPKWKPGLQDGEPVRVQYRLPVKFTVRDYSPRGYYEPVPSLAKYSGGSEAMDKFINENLIYPEKAITDSVTGVVKLSMLIKVNGKISKVKVLSGLSTECDAEAIRLVESMPRWIPCKKGREYVNQTVNVEIPFGVIEE